MTRTLTTVLVTIVLFILIAVLAGVIFVYSGAYNVAATESHGGLYRWIVLTTTEQSIANYSDAYAPVDLPSDSTASWRGFIAFEDMCVQCHGAPGVDRGWIGKGVAPTPPSLHEEASDMNDAELFWVIRHGIKFTSMPALEPTHTDDEIKELAAFVRDLPSIDSAEYAARRQAIEDALADTNSTGALNGIPADDGHDHVH